FDPPSVYDLDPPRVLHFPAVGCPSVPGNGKLLCGGVPVLVGFPKDLADTPFKFLKACGKTGEEKLHLLRAYMEPGDDIAFPGAVGIIVDRYADDQVTLLVVLCEHSLGV